jgi:hypothetical protein
MVEGMSNISLDFDFYEHFLDGKKKWVRFPSGAMRLKGILQLVHSDVLDFCQSHHWENLCAMSHL